MNYCVDAFGAYDIRGIYPTVINEEIAYRIGFFFPKLINAKKIVIGNDIRRSSSSLKYSLIQGVLESGCDVIDIGQCGTEMIYFATAFYRLDGGIMITASHNPCEYNGMKIVQREARPVYIDTGMRKLKEWVAEALIPDDRMKVTGKVEVCDIVDDYVKHICSCVDLSKLKPFNVVVNAGNGTAGPIIDVFEKYLPFQMIKINHNPDGNFPNGVPNPLLLENQEVTSKAVREFNADIGVAWDGDFDRCFIFDECGNFIEGYYLVGLLAQFFLKKNHSAKIIYDPRLIWNTKEIVRENGGESIISKSGHAYFKEQMRREDAIYGGEMSGHHYFRDFFYCDSGMLTWLIVMEMLSEVDGGKISDLLSERMHRFWVSGEINSRIKDVDYVLEKIERKYGKKGKVTKIDGLSVELSDWRFNLRKSNTEPVIRLNVESYCDEDLMKKKTEELLNIIRKEGDEINAIEG